VNDDYLWDGTGEPDPEVKRMETLLGRFRHRGGAMEFPATAHPAAQRKVPWRIWAPRLAAAAAMVAIAAVVWFSWRRSNPPETAPLGWSVEPLAGAPHVGTEVISKAGGSVRLLVGQTLETDSRSRASIRVDQTGEVRVDPDTRVRLLGAASAHKRLALDRGTIHATIWAPPGEFVVDTPSAVAVDLGCAYTLHVDDSGAGLLRTTLGWVGFKLNGREFLIPAGAACATRPRSGPGTPYFEDASQSFRDALARLDFNGDAADRRAADLSVVLSESRKRDALTLWHLLSRVNESERSRVYDRLDLLVPPPPHVTRAGVLHLDREMLDLWWNEFDLGDMSLWRTWERSWSEPDTSKSPRADR
jgi:FecR protein